MMSLAKEFEGQLWVRAADHQAELAQQAAVIEQMLNLINAYHSPDHPLRLQALAIQPCPEVLNKVRADAVSNAIDAWMCSSAYVNEECIELWFMNYAQRIEKGEA